MTTPPLQNESAPPPKPQGSWFGRHWGKLLGCGCLTVVGGIVGVLALGAYSLDSRLKASVPYKMALEKVRGTPEVVKQLGEPIEAGFPARGFIREGTGTADFIFPVSGPRGSGTVHVSADTRTGTWGFFSLTFITAGGGNSIQLVEPEVKVQKSPFE